MKNVCVLMFLMISTAVSVLGQSIANQLLIADCSFRLFDGPTELKVIDQMVTKRTVRGSNTELKTFGEAYFIEFTYVGNEMVLENAQVEFLDEDKRPLHEISLDDSSRYMKVNMLGSRPSPQTRFVAISLEGIPLRLLDGVVSIRIKAGSSRKG
jgi:hypothetical protein